MPRTKGEKKWSQWRNEEKNACKKLARVHKFGRLHNKSPLFITRMTYCSSGRTFIMHLCRGHKGVESQHRLIRSEFFNTKSISPNNQKNTRFIRHDLGLEMNGRCRASLKATSFVNTLLKFTALFIDTSNNSRASVDTL